MYVSFLYKQEIVQGRQWNKLSYNWISRACQHGAIRFRYCLWAGTAHHIRPTVAKPRGTLV